MSQRFIRCGHCHMPHGVGEVYCPATGKAIRAKVVKEPERAPASVPSRASSAPGSRRSKPRSLIGKTLGGKYAIRRVLGEGGMGTVFEGEQLGLGRSIAVKVLHAAQAAKPDVVRRFQQEARSAASIGHPNICAVIDFGTLDDGSPYIVMERLVGETLADRVLSDGGLPFGDVIEILVQILSGLVAAHEKGIVHRDIKPENVFLTTRVGCPPLVKLLDFGVSKVSGPQSGIRDEELNLTRTGMVMGTPYYMAPEQARGERDLDARVDLYACGVIFYELLTGRRPFTASNYNALLVQILSGTPRPARDLRPALLSGYDEVIDKAMARRREDRYPTAAAFQRDLQGLRDRHGTKTTGSVLDGPDRNTSSTRKAPARPLELPTSSEEIPVTFAADTPTSGGTFAIDPTEVHLRADSSYDSGDDSSDGDPTQLMAPGRPSRR